MESSLLKEYKEHVVPSLKEKLGCTNIHQVPRVDKVVINCGIGSATAERKQAVEEAIEEMGVITGQRAVRTKAKLSSNPPSVQSSKNTPPTPRASWR